MPAAWLDPDEVAGWYGPAQMDAPRERIRIEPRVGGRWELTMARRDGGGEMAIGYEILELVEPELLVMRSDPTPEMGMSEGTVVRVELREDGAKTRMTLSDGPMPAAGRGPAEAGWSAAMGSSRAGWPGRRAGTPIGTAVQSTLTSRASTLGVERTTPRRKALHRMNRSSCPKK